MVFLCVGVQVASQAIDNNLLKWGAREYYLKAGLCHMATGVCVHLLLFPGPFARQIRIACLASAVKAASAHMRRLLLPSNYCLAACVRRFDAYLHAHIHAGGVCVTAIPN